MFSTPIGSKLFDFSVQLVFHFCLIFQKHFLNLIFVPKEVYFGISRVVIQKGDVIFFPPLLTVFLKFARSKCTSSSNYIFLLVTGLKDFLAYLASTYPLAPLASYTTESVTTSLDGELTVSLMAYLSPLLS